MGVSFRNFIYILGVAFLIQTQFKTISQFGDLRKVVGDVSATGEARILSQTPTRDSTLYQACPATADLFDYEELHASIHNATQFHLFGGNLRSVQSYKTQMIDNTAKGAHVVYESQGKNYTGKYPSDSISKVVKDYNTKHRDVRGGYGQKLAGEFKTVLTENYAQKIPSMHEMRRFDVREKYDHSRFKVAMGPMAPMCKNLIMFGGDRGEEQKWVCSDAEDIPEDCVVISLGSNDQWEMETALVEKGCTAHTFDCTLPNHTPLKKPDSDRIHFYPYCLDATSHTDTVLNRSYLSYADAFALTGLTKAPTLLKMDIEGFEFDVLQSMIATPAGEGVHQPQQIMVELHWATRMHDVPWMLRTVTSAELALFSSTLFAGGGYMPVLRHGKSCKSCQEVLYVKVACPSIGLLDVY